MTPTRHIQPARRFMAPLGRRLDYPLLPCPLPSCSRKRPRLPQVATSLVHGTPSFLLLHRNPRHRRLSDTPTTRRTYGQHGSATTGLCGKSQSRKSGTLSTRTSTVGMSSYSRTSHEALASLSPTSSSRRSAMHTAQSLGTRHGWSPTAARRARQTTRRRSRLPSPSRPSACSWHWLSITTGKLSKPTSAEPSYMISSPPCTQS